MKTYLFGELTSNQPIDGVPVHYQIFLDDIRDPPEKGLWIVCRTVQEAIDVIRTRGLPTFISFDHDLGAGQQDGIELAKWLINSHLDLEIDILSAGFSWTVHSMNPIGRANIIGLLNGFETHMKRSQRAARE